MDGLGALFALSLCAGTVVVVVLLARQLGRGRRPGRLHTLREFGGVDANRYTPPLTQPMPRSAVVPPKPTEHAEAHGPIAGARHLCDSDIDSVVIRFESVTEEAVLMHKGLDSIGESARLPKSRAALAELIHYLCTVRRLVDPFTLTVGVRFRRQSRGPRFADAIQFPGLPHLESAALIEERLSASLARHLDTGAK